MSQYFNNDRTIKNDIKKYNVKFKEQSFSFSTNAGVFGKEKLDYGTRFLLETLCDNTNLHGNILDLGCGYGPVGVILGNLYKSANIDMIDINERALELSKINLNNNNVLNANVWSSNIYENVDKEYNYIITNPPIRAGKETVKKFLIGAKNHLLSDGELWFVMRKDHGVKTIINILEVYYSIRIVDRSKGFFVIQAKPLIKN